MVIKEAADVTEDKRGEEAGSPPDTKAIFLSSSVPLIDPRYVFSSSELMSISKQFRNFRFFFR